MTIASRTSVLTARLGLAPPFDRLLFIWLATMVCLSEAFVTAAVAKRTETYFLIHQDLVVLALSLLTIIALAHAPAVAAPRLSASLAKAPRSWVLGLAILCVVVGAAGAPFIFGGYTLSLDEFLANFDAKIFAHGQLMAPIAPQWRPLAPALQPLYMLPVPDNAYWASGYLPINALARAGASLLGLSGLVNPLFSGFSILAVYGIGRRLWPDRPAMALGAAALLASSSQLIVMSMTAYAMPGHLALNLAWLWLFLRGGKLGHSGAVLMAFLAMGLHQMIFHPLFAAPFILQLWLDGRRRLAIFYAVAYALMSLFWIEYWQIEVRVMGLSADDAQALGGDYFSDRLSGIFSAVAWSNFDLMGLCLVRFVTWQNPLTVPLALAAAAMVFGDKGVMRALGLGVILTLTAMLLLVPTQTHGWGYRYFHGLLGSFCLIAMQGWAQLTDGMATDRRAAANTAFVAACIVSLVILTPLRAWQAWAFVRPYAVANAEIQSAPAQVVIVDHEGQYGFDPGTVVRNDPYLSSGPKVMQLYAMDDEMLRAVCARNSVLVFDDRAAHAAGINTIPMAPSPDIMHLRATMRRLNCGRSMSATGGAPPKSVSPAA